MSCLPIVLAACLPVIASFAVGLPDSGALQKTVLATNLNEPIALSIARDGQVYIAERHGRIQVWKPETETINLAGQLPVFTGPEDGLLCLVLDPKFQENHWIYLFHSTPGLLENRVSRFTIVQDVLDLNSQKVLLRIPTVLKKPNHSGGCLAFDGAGNLYASTGDYTFINDSDGYSPLDDRPGRELHDSQRTAANTNDPRGKILRVHPEPDGTYTIPRGNLFPSGMSNALPEIYIMGCRNPFRFTVDSKSGWLVWGDVGPDALESNPKRGPAGFDEFNRAQQAGNFGWPYFVADNKAYVAYDFGSKVSGQPFDPLAPVNASRNNTGLTKLPPAQPAFIWYPPGPSARFPELGSGARSAMAGPVYHFDPELRSNRKLPVEFDNCLFIFDWERSWIKTVRFKTDGPVEKISPFAPEITIKRPICLSIGPDGALFVVEWGTAWYNNQDAQVVRVDFVPR